MGKLNDLPPRPLLQVCPRQGCSGTLHQHYRLAIRWSGLGFTKQSTEYRISKEAPTCNKCKVSFLLSGSGYNTYFADLQTDRNSTIWWYALIGAFYVAMGLGVVGIYQYQ